MYLDILKCIVENGNVNSMSYAVASTFSSMGL